MKSLAPKDFESLPGLDPPAGYICVIRDIDRDRFLIEATHWPKALVNEVIAERDRSFGIELVSVMQTDDLAASEAELYARQHARLGSEWLELDALQLEELRQSMLQIDAHASQYISASSQSTATGGPALGNRSNFRPGRVSQAARSSDRRAGGERTSRPLASHHYGYWVMGRRRRSREGDDVASANRSISLRQGIGHWVDDQLTRNPIVVFAIILIIALICFGWIRDRTFLHPASKQPAPVTIATKASISQPHDARPTPAGTPYLFALAAPVYSCASTTCRQAKLLPKRTQIWALETLKGSPVNGSTIWMKFQLNGEAAYVHISYLEPLD